MTDEPQPFDVRTLNPTGRFSNRAQDYRRYRPDYPAAAIDVVLNGLGDSSKLLAADIGAGTGISARALADRGVRVIAIEPNAAMRAAAEPHPGVTWRDASAEATALAEGSLGLVLCAQAFHWFEPAAALVEFHRVLRPQGRLVLMWNHRDGRDPLTRGYIEAIHAVNGEHPAERIDPDLAAVVGAHGFTVPRLETIPHAQALDLGGLLGRAGSASYVSKDAGALVTLERLLTALHGRHADSDGRVRLRYETLVYVCEAAPRQAFPSQR